MTELETKLRNSLRFAHAKKDELEQANATFEAAGAAAEAAGLDVHAIISAVYDEYE